MNDSKPIPKSLHTVTVLVAVARHIRFTDSHLATGTCDAEYVAVERALGILGYTDVPDTYQLAAAARKQLAREVRS